jgi:hypothetical protein
MLHQNLLINWVDAFLCDQSLSNIDLADRPDAVKSVFKLFEVLISLKGGAHIKLDVIPGMNLSCVFDGLKSDSVRSYFLELSEGIVSLQLQGVFKHA